MRSFLFAATMLTSAPAFAAVHNYAGLALSARGDELASIEAGADGHSAVVVRSAADGRVLRTVDPCKTCAYSGLSYGPDGALAFLSRDKGASGGSTPKDDKKDDTKSGGADAGTVIVSAFVVPVLW